ncbi:Stk1 family PASTA domain-containing Ser/Thr kinase [Corynebacterium hylobatis]|uniref:non-specific serine/threonine protein kinase n=1 Tax=Corynebacterium hylobatis TaxID=1859290 RepID=A0A430HX98_9CORY|nr:Stk1 family PASTA domain-containing Ser/Thr kinase [Corynebacterium hylobatis]RSZ62717.1 Stk1 family PASTA domain-containing Ser/Thr kinase [Corynebacterium hylobatis]
MAQLAVGDLLDDRYRIDHPIARGGMSTVYRCVDLRLGRAVAAKVLDEKYITDPVFRQRFRREALAMAQLTHPNLVNVYDFGSDGDHLFLVMELITGGTLRELLAERGPMPPHAAAAVLRAVLTGLSAAHTAGMVHRDIKPDNILINGDHRVKLADFGLVRSATAATTATNQIVGTAAYLSPEQVDGTDITPASDVYSAGIVLFELLTGTVPFSGDNPLDHAYQRLEEDVPAPSSRIGGVPSLIDALVGTATARAPQDRFADAAEFLAALDDVAAELTLPAFTVPVPQNSAAHRAAAVPTDITDLVGPPAMVTEITDVPPTAVVAPVAEPPVEQTRVHEALGPQAPPALPAEIPSAPLEAPPPPKPLSNRGRTGLIVWLVVISLLTAAVAVGGWWFGSGRYGEIPQVLGMDRAAAVATIEDAGFTPVTEIVYNDEVPTDRSAGTQPGDGEKVVRGGEVTVLVSQGRPTVPAPEGMDVLAYQAAASERTLTVANGEPVYSPDVEEGRVALTEPAAGEPVAIGTTVTVHVSRGPEPIQVPSVIGLDITEAEARLAELGLTVATVDRRYEEDVPGGEVLEVSPDPGTELSRGSEISLVVSGTLTVPEVSGMDQATATATLEAAGFTVDDVRRDRSATGAGPDTAVGTSPAAGELIDPADAEITLELAGRVTVPDVVGMTVGQARQLLAGVGLDINSRERDDARPITRQRPAAGEDARIDSTVRLTLGR